MCVDPNVCRTRVTLLDYILSFRPRTFELSSSSERLSCGFPRALISRGCTRLMTFPKLLCLGAHQPSRGAAVSVLSR